MKVLIVGGGPAGLSCAKQILAQSEVDVTVVDRKQKIGENPRCAGGISLWMAEKVGVSIPETCIVARIRRVRMYAPNGNYWELSGDRDYGYILNREFFEYSLAKEVERLGGKIVLGHAVSSKDLEFWQSKYNSIVGADGPTSVVRQWLNLSKHRDLHLGFQKTITIENYSQDTIEIYFGHNVAPEGYAWIFPVGENLVRIGLGIPVWRDYRVHELLQNFIQKQAPKNYKEVGSVAKLIPTGKMPETGVYGNVLLVGDALPSTNPLTGGGIIQGIASGKAAGQAIAEENPENYDSYVEWLRRQNLRRYRLKQVLCKLRDEDFNELITIMKVFKPKSMSVGRELQRALVHFALRKPHKLIKWAFADPIKPKKE